MSRAGALRDFRGTEAAWYPYALEMRPGTAMDRERSGGARVC